MRCKEEGLIDHIVISTHLPGPQVKEIIQKNEFEGVLLGVNILNRTDKEMLKKRMGLYRWSLLADRVANAGDCIECGACEGACTQHLNIIERLKEIAAWERILDSKMNRFLGFAKKARQKLTSLFRS